MPDGVDAGQARPGTRRALVVAVDANRREQLGHELEAIGLEPVLATDGKQAERSAAANLPDVLVLDRGMPGLVLFRLYSSLRGLPGGADVPIFFVGQPGTDTPTDQYLPSELSVREIADRVRDGLGLSATAGPTTAPAEPTIAPVEPVAPAPPSDVTFEPTAVGTQHAPVAPPDVVAAPMPPPTVTAEPPPVATHEPPPVVTAAPAPATDERSPGPAGGVSRISRLDVVLLRLGLVVLLLGGAVLLLRPDSSTQPIAPPDLATATPAARPTLPASPSPAAVVAPGR